MYAGHDKSWWLPAIRFLSFLGLVLGVPFNPVKVKL